MSAEARYLLWMSAGFCVASFCCGVWSVMREAEISHLTRIITGIPFVMLYRWCIHRACLAWESRR